MNDHDGWSHLLDIAETESEHLSGKTVVICVSASVAALEIHRVARLLIRHGARVKFFLTPSACELVSPTSLEWCTGSPVVTKLTGRCEHLEYFGHLGKGDLLLLAPATANTIAKVAHGIDDNAVTTAVTTAIGSEIPVLVCPGMHEPMLKNPAVIRNLAALEAMGVGLLAPLVSEGKAKMMAASEIVARVCRLLGPRDLAGKRVLLTGGPTREYLDPARCLTNPSSGLSACLLADEAFRRGANVTLVYGPGQTQPSPWLDVLRVETSDEMRDAAVGALANAEVDFVLAVAAVSDFRPVDRSTGKLATSEHRDFSLRLVTTPKIIDELRRLSPTSKLVAFKASSATDDETMVAQARSYLDADRADFVVANSVTIPGQGFESVSNRYIVCSEQGAPTCLGPAPKHFLAQLLWDHVLHPS